MPTLITSALVAGFFVLTGTNAVSAPEAPAVVELPSYTVAMTAYNALVGQTDADPFTTASGLYSNPEIIAARSVDLKDELPFGTVIAISRAAADTNNCRFSEVDHLIGYRVVGDSMNSRMVNKIDVLLDHTDTIAHAGKQMNPARVMGICDEVTIEVVGYMELKEVPGTQDELVAMIEESRLQEN